MKSILILLLVNASMGLNAQTDVDSQEQVRATIDQLFNGMRSGDSSMVRAVFHPDVRLMSTYQKEGENRVHTGSLIEFLEAIGTPHDEIWDERISNVVIQVDAGLAQVWMDYSFYIGDQPSHSGVNAVQLVKINDRWLIVQLMDTRKKID